MTLLLSHEQAIQKNIEIAREATGISSGSEGFLKFLLPATASTATTSSPSSNLTTSLGMAENPFLAEEVVDPSQYFRDRDAPGLNPALAKLLQEAPVSKPVVKTIIRPPSFLSEPRKEIGSKETAAGFMKYIDIRDAHVSPLLIGGAKSLTGAEPSGEIVEVGMFGSPKETTLSGVGSGSPSDFYPKNGEEIPFFGDFVSVRGLI